jgi:hypothetical protein
MKNIIWIFNIIVQFTLLMVLLFNRKSYMHCTDLDS